MVPQMGMGHPGRKPRPNTIVDFPEGRIRFERPDGSLAGSPTHGSMFITFRKEGQAKLF